MITKIEWNIGREGTEHARLDQQPFRAFFSWLRDGRVIECADFSRLELEDEIEKRRLHGQNTVEFDAALKELSK